MGKPALHHSVLATLSKCGLQAMYRYVEGKKSPPGIALIVGTATHRAAEHSLRAKMATGHSASIEEVKEIAAKVVEDEWSSDIVLDEEEKTIGAAILKGEAKDDAVSLSVLHVMECEPHLNPIAVERKMRLELPGYPFDLEGTIDVEESAGIRDRKTSSKSPTGSEVVGNVQLDFYSMMRAVIDKKPAEYVALDYLVKSRQPKYVEVKAPAAISFEHVVRRVELAAHVFQTGAFYPVDPSGPSGWVCAPKWCGYYNECPFGARRRRQG
jgi:hypothetical protein